MYMSYCRFEGADYELRACLGDVYEHVNEEAEYEVSDNEIRHFKNMVEFFYNAMCELELLDENGVLDEDELDKVCEAMSKGYKEEE